MRRRSSRCSRRSQFETLEALVDAIIPTDERSPGAKQARVADYIDLLLSEVDRELTLAMVRWPRGARRRSRVAVPRAVRRLSAGQVDEILQTHQPQRDVRRERRSRPSS